MLMKKYVKSKVSSFCKVDMLYFVKVVKLWLISKQVINIYIYIWHLQETQYIFIFDTIIIFMCKRIPS